MIEKSRLLAYEPVGHEIGVTQIVVLAFVPVLVSGCARRSSLESAQARLAESQGQLSKAEQDLLRTKDELSDAKARLKEANERIAELQGRLSLLKLVPVRVRFKPAPPGLGQVMGRSHIYVQA